MKTELFVWVAILAITISSPLSAVAEDETSYQAPLLLEVQPAGAPKLSRLKPGDSIEGVVRMTCTRGNEN